MNINYNNDLHDPRDARDAIFNLELDLDVENTSLSPPLSESNQFYTRNNNIYTNRNRVNPIQGNYNINRNTNHNNRRRYREQNIYTNRTRDRYRNRDSDRVLLQQLYNELRYQNNLLQSMRIDISNIWNRINIDQNSYNSNMRSNMRSNMTPNVITPNVITPNVITPNTNLNSDQRININDIPYIVERIQQMNINPRRRTNVVPNHFINSVMNLMDFNSSVPVIPSREQILNSTRDIQFGDIENPINTSCPISLETFNDNDMVTQILHCGHNFNSRQLITWFQSNVRCPMCRYDIRDYTTTTIDGTSTSSTSSTSESRENSRIPTRIRETPSRTFTNAFSDDSINNITNITNSLSNIAFNTINEIFEQNSDTFTDNGNSRYLFDPSNNILLFETIINTRNINTPNVTNTTNTNTNTRANTNNRERDPDPRNIV